MEMREGLELANVAHFKEHVIALKDPDRMPWYARQIVFWLCSFCLLSWPLRLLLEYNTAYLHYRVTKLFGVNYENSVSEVTTPSGCVVSGGGGEDDSDSLEWCIRENTTLVPSYSEALLMASSSSTATRGLTLYYASPLVEGCPQDPFEEPPTYDEALTLPPLLGRLTRSLTNRVETTSDTTTTATHVLLHPRPSRTVITMETSL
ncbi:hypothetical protein AAG570_008956 [Ranatra chinensis]|uniref:Uncharacterized protein n=1 Tax=Ranatra chinensis TaxID=642074 RepID=A0ABD0YSC7_9HEMI